jgi:peptidoglycan/LPS O-acetylase OafA/YrhL
MTLSGYLFAKLLDGKDINYLSFFCNRALRLLPLLSLVLLIVGIRDYFGGGHHFLYLRKVLAGILLPVLPNGGWSVTVEFHFYLALP